MSINPGNIIFKAGQSLDKNRLYHEASHSGATIASTADSDGVAICLTHITAIFFYCYDFRAQSSVINAAAAKEPCKRSLDARKGMDDYYKKKVNGLL